MNRKLFYGLIIIALVLSGPVSAGFASSGANAAPHALGTLAPAGRHLVRPLAEAVESVLKQEGKISLNASADEIKAAQAEYYDAFDKKSSDWVSPAVEKKVLDHEQALGKGLAPQADPAPSQVAVKVFALAVEFAGVDETVPYCDTSGTFSGPLQGQLNPPDASDNNTLYYTPEQTASTDFYSDLIFGYKGIGRIRFDMRDPKDGMPGVNLAGYTVQDYYDHFAGKGNVTLEGSVNGWVAVNHSEAYYGAPSVCSPALQDDGGGEVPVGQLVPDALDVFQAEHPTYFSDTSASAFWPQFDQNHDGEVDAMWIIHAGRGEEAGGGAQGAFAIWSHSWSLSGNMLDPYKVYEGDPSTEADDIYVNPYTMQPEDADLGVLVEEFGHNFFGLPDLYTTDVQNSVGFWSEMSGGSWGGPLGGTVPVGMPLWFRMLAWCDTAPCNWQFPMVTRDYQDASADITLGAMDGFAGGTGVNKGVRVNLPPVMVAVPNKTTGTGKAAYSTPNVDNLDQSFKRDVAIPADATGVLSFKSFSDTEENYDYAYVQVKEAAAADSTYATIRDMDGRTSSTPLGYGLTGRNKQFTMRYDLAAYKGKTVTLRLRLVTDTGTNYTGWWVDDLKLDDTLLNDFEDASGTTFPGWVNDPVIQWQEVPYSSPYANYYLLEWRADTKYDSSLKTAYLTVDSGADLWTVDRVPYNIPGAVLYYRDTRFGTGYSQFQNYALPPSFGPKNKILVVDMNFDPMRATKPDDGLASSWLVTLNNRTAAYDAALTLQPSQPLTLTGVYTATGTLPGPFNFPAKPPVTTFNDAKGYYAGWTIDDDPDACGAGFICYTNRDGSVVIPARGPYSQRVTNYGGNPLYDYYGMDWVPSWLGSGNPGDDNVQYGVNIDLLSKSVDGLTGVVRVRNYSADFTAESVEMSPLVDVFDVVYTASVVNNGTEPVKDVRLTFNLDPELTFLKFEAATGSAGASQLTPQGMVKVYNIPSLAAGASMEVKLTARYTPFVEPEAKALDQVTTTLEINDGQMVRGPYWLTTDIVPFFHNMLPLINK